MGLLLYKSNEMFSSTELIRKSKMIFDKILDEEIEKAIILRDGKPSFLLMEFKKYEKIMAEFEELKEYIETIENKSIPIEKKKKEFKNLENTIEKTEKSKKVKKKDLKNNIEAKNKLKEELIRQSNRIKIEARDYSERIKEVVVLEEVPIETDETENINEPISEQLDEQLIEETDAVIEELTQEDEINNALKSIENMNFDDEMKKVAQEKVKAKIIQARNERAILLAQEQEEQPEEDEDLEVEQHIEDQKEKKQRELKEFWD